MQVSKVSFDIEAEEIKKGGEAAREIGAHTEP